MTPGHRDHRTIQPTLGKTARGFLRAGRRAAKDTSGAAAVEFAIVVWPFFLLVFMSLQTALLFFVDQALQTATVQSARYIMTGQAASMNQAAYKAYVCGKLPSLFNCANLMVDVQTASSYAGINTAALIPTYTKNPVTGQETLNNSGWAYQTSSASGVVILRVMYDFPVIGGAFAFANQPNGTFLLVGTSVFKNEPYPELMNRRLARRLTTNATRQLPWREDTRGAAAVEFALLLPVLVALYLGGFETLRLVSSYRKVCDTTAQLANVATLTGSTTKAEVQSNMAAAAQIMSPYSTSSLEIITTEITTDSSSKATVTWSQAWKNGAEFDTGKLSGSWTLPTALVMPSTSYVLVQTSFTYTSLLGGRYIGASIPLASQLYMSPRTSQTISCPDC